MQNEEDYVVMETIKLRKELADIITDKYEKYCQEVEELSANKFVGAEDALAKGVLPVVDGKRFEEVSLLMKEGDEGDIVLYACFHQGKEEVRMPLKDQPNVIPERVVR